METAKSIIRKAQNQKFQSTKKIHLLKIYFSLSILGLLFSCTTEEEGIYFNETYETYEMKEGYSKIEIQILDFINDYRVTRNLQPLNRLNSISSVALSHTKYMIGTGMVSHDKFSERSDFLMINENAQSVGENVAYGHGTAKDVVNAWIKSDSHRAVIENENYTEFGISVEKSSEGRNFFTQIFIVK
ncbi:MAG: CAP domain-containing protein [Bacteroidetes bacterium]|nr:CAP domain-containing protein [Bacteroidota bacterium]